MKKILLCRLACIMLTAVFCPSSYAETISSDELIKEARRYDGENILYRGEVVGDIMIRGEYAWLNVYDGSSAIGVWVNKESIKDIVYAGSYQAKGDLVEIAGKFNRSCVEHGGDLDIHAQSLNKIGSGSRIHHAVNRKAVNLALSLGCLILSILFLRICLSKKS